MPSLGVSLEWATFFFGGIGRFYCSSTMPGECGTNVRRFGYVTYQTRLYFIPKTEYFIPYYSALIKMLLFPLCPAFT